MLTVGNENRPRFPGATNSPVTTKMDFVVPKNIPPIATYRIMNADGVIEDESLAPEGVTNDQIIEWYKNMLTGMFTR